MSRRHTSRRSASMAKIASCGGLLTATATSPGNAASASGGSTSATLVRQARRSVPCARVSFRPSESMTASSSPSPSRSTTTASSTGVASNRHSGSPPHHPARGAHASSSAPQAIATNRPSGAIPTIHGAERRGGIMQPGESERPDGREQASRAGGGDSPTRWARRLACPTHLDANSTSCAQPTGGGSSSQDSWMSASAWSSA